MTQLLGVALRGTGSCLPARVVPNDEFTEVERLPHVYELLTKEQREIWTALIEAPQAMDKPIVLPPGTPDTILSVYRNALDTAMKDKNFRAGIVKFTGVPAGLTPGDKVQEEAAEAERLWLRYREQEVKLRSEMYNKYMR